MTSQGFDQEQKINEEVQSQKQERLKDIFDSYDPPFLGDEEEERKPPSYTSKDGFVIKPVLRGFTEIKNYLKL